MKPYRSNELRSLSYHFIEWHNVMRDYYEIFYENDDENDDDDDDDDDGDDLDQYREVRLKLHNIFETILKFFTRYGEFKDSWDFPARIDISTFGQHATVGSEKLGIDFDFGIDYANFFLSTYLYYPSNIKKMNDSFWSHFTALDSLGQFNFYENNSP